MQFVRHNGNPGFPGERRYPVTRNSESPPVARLSRPLRHQPFLPARTCKDPRCPPVIPFPPRDPSHVPGGLDPVAPGAEDLEVHLRPLVPAHRDRADMVEDVREGGRPATRAPDPGLRISLLQCAHLPSCSRRMISLISPTVGRCPDQYDAVHDGPQQMASHPGVKSSRSRPQTGQAPQARRFFSEGVLAYRRYSLWIIFLFP